MQRCNGRVFIGLTLITVAVGSFSYVLQETSNFEPSQIVIPAIENPIKIRPINTSCMAFIKEEAVYSSEIAIPYEKQGDEISHINVAGHPEKITTDPHRTVKDKSVIKRASSIHIIKGCNNDI